MLRGSLGVGLQAGETAPLPPQGVAANLRFARIDVDAWERVFSEASGVDVVLDLAPLPPLADEMQTLLFRVAQEALNNAIKHAHAPSVLVRLVERSGRAQLQVIDDGDGFDVAAALQSGGSGLGGMRERVRLYEGQFDVQSAPGHGTRVRVSVPLAAPPAA